MSCRRATLLWALVLVVLAAWPGTAGAQVEDWEITRFDAVIEVNENGDLHVTETIELDFGGASGHLPLHPRGGGTADPRAARAGPCPRAVTPGSSSG